MESPHKDFLSDLQAVIFCGGMGTRLREGLKGTPKSLAPIGGRAFLEYLLQTLVAAGIRRMVLCTGYRRELIRAYFGDGSDFGAAIQYSEEEKAQGTGGALKNAQRYVHSNPFLLCNGDSLMELDYVRLLAKHLNAKAKVTLAMAQVADGSRYGNVAALSDGRVAQLIEKPEKELLGEGPAWIYGGVCVMDQSVFQEIPNYPPPASLELDVFSKLIGHGLFAERFTGFFVDIGTPEDYEHACKSMPQRFGFAHSHSR